MRIKIKGKVPRKVLRLVRRLRLENLMEFDKDFWLNMWRRNHKTINYYDVKVW